MLMTLTIEAKKNSEEGKRSRSEQFLFKSKTMTSVYSILLLVYFTNFNVEGYLVTFSTKLGDIAGTESR